jgi:hypothetical protein
MRTHTGPRFIVSFELIDGVPSINFGDENIYFGATTILFGGALNGCLKLFAFVVRKVVIVQYYICHLLHVVASCM